MFQQHATCTPYQVHQVLMLTACGQKLLLFVQSFCPFGVNLTVCCLFPNERVLIPLSDLKVIAVNGHLFSVGNANPLRLRGK